MLPTAPVAGRYRLIELIGRGGMGAVWRAHDQVLDREVAVKEVVLPPEIEDDVRELYYRRTLREARSAARLDHPSIITVHDVVEEDGRPWIVMRLVRAESLSQVIARTGGLPPHEVAEIGLQLLDALSAAHAAGVLHRDVKPSNILVEGRRAVLTDFGIASLEGDAALTGSEVVLGSPAYLAHERALRQTATPASDLWSLGATLYAAVEGQGPYHRPDIWGVMAALVAQEPDPPRRAGVLTPVLAGLLRRDPAQRLTADQARPLLQQAAAALPPQPEVDPDTVSLPSRPPASPTSPTSPPRSIPKVWLILPGAVLAACVVVAVLLAHNAASPSRGNGGVPGSTASASPPAPRSGYHEYSNSVFSAYVPNGWQATGQADSDINFQDPGTVRGIAFQTLPGVGGDATVDLDAVVAAGQIQQDFPGASVGSVRKVDGYMDSAADIEFTATKNGKPVHVVNRLAVSGGHAVLLTMVTLAQDWQGSQTYWTTFLSTLHLKNV